METYHIQCKCGYTAKATYREKDNMYSSRAIWSFNGFSCKKDTVERGGYMSLDQALSEANPVCPECGIDVAESMFIKTEGNA